jgi:hypothetical protein
MRSYEKMRNATKSTLYGLLCSVGLFLSACSGSAEDEPVYMVDSDSGDVSDSAEYSPTRKTDGNVAPSSRDALPRAPGDTSVEVLEDASRDASADAYRSAPEDASSTAAEDASLEVLEDASIDTSQPGVEDASSTAPSDASGDAPELLDAGDGNADCNPIGRWRVYINQSPIQCFNTQGAEGFFIEVSSAECAQDLEISLDINALPGIWGHFVGTISYQLVFDGDALTATAEIAGTITNGSGTMQCESTAFVTGVRT